MSDVNYEAIAANALKSMASILVPQPNQTAHPPLSQQGKDALKQQLLTSIETIITEAFDQVTTKKDIDKLYQALSIKFHPDKLVTLDKDLHAFLVTHELVNAPQQTIQSIYKSKNNDTNTNRIFDHIDNNLPLTGFKIIDTHLKTMLKQLYSMCIDVETRYQGLIKKLFQAIYITYIIAFAVALLALAAIHLVVSFFVNRVENIWNAALDYLTHNSYSNLKPAYFDSDRENSLRALKKTVIEEVAALGNDDELKAVERMDAEEIYQYKLDSYKAAIRSAVEEERAKKENANPEQTSEEYIEMTEMEIVTQAEQLLKNEFSNSYQAIINTTVKSLYTACQETNNYAFKALYLTAIPVFTFTYSLITLVQNLRNALSAVVLFAGLSLGLAIVSTFKLPLYAYDLLNKKETTLGNGHVDVTPVNKKEVLLITHPGKNGIFRPVDTTGAGIGSFAEMPGNNF